MARAARSCRAKFLGYYPRGFVDADYVDLERGYKWTAHERWKAELSRKSFASLLTSEKYKEIAARAVAGYSGDGGQAFQLKADSDSSRLRTAFR
jgi:secreted PhoX family phosphatase